MNRKFILSPPRYIGMSDHDFVALGWMLLLIVEREIPDLSSMFEHSNTFLSCVLVTEKRRLPRAKNLANRNRTSDRWISLDFLQSTALPTELSRDCSCRSVGRQCSNCLWETTECHRILIWCPSFNECSTKTVMPNVHYKSNRVLDGAKNWNKPWHIESIPGILINKFNVRM